jgi:ATP-dependent helicase/nuclease subunit A
MSPLDFTDKQRDAVEAPGTVTVRAGAGSGKTAVLTARYLRALTDGHEPHRIVAITFTDKAAAEMRERIRGELAAFAAGPGEAAARLARLRDHLADAPISTIHGLCSALLHEFPVEASVDPRFDVAEETTAYQRRRAAVDAAIETAAQDEKHPARPALDLLLTFYSRAELARMLGQILDKRRYFPDETCRLLGLATDDLLAEWRRRLHEEICTAARALAARKAVASLRRELAALVEQCTDTGDRLFQNARSVLDAFDVLSDARQDRVLDAAFCLRAALTTTQGTARSFGGKGKASNWPADTLERTGNTLTALGEPVRSLAPFGAAELDEGDALVARMVRALWRLANEVEVHYAAAKGNGRVLDFDDLEERTIALLDSPRHGPVLETLRRRYRLVLVDEAQDLNLLQFRLVRLLLDTQGRPEPNTGFIVGDPQQSIFAFRNADVRLFGAMCAGLLPTGGEHKELVENFRSTPALVAFANRLFGELMAGGDVFEVGYGPMKARRAQRAESLIELVLAAEQDTGTLDEAQAHAVAERITRLVEDGVHRIPCDRKAPDGALRPAIYADVAVLVRTRKVIPPLLEALRARAIPCAVYKGIGFYQTQEVRDVYTALRFLGGPERDLELAGVLRSPFFGLSDDGLFVLAHGRGETPLYERLLDTPRLDELSVTDREVVGRARRLIPSWLAMVDLVPPSALLRRMLDETGAWGTYAAMGGAGTINKLLRVLRVLQRPAPSLAQVADLLEDHILNVQREGDELAEALEDEAVKIMTVHGAKGLEFPVVFVLGLDDDLTRRGRPQSIQIDPDLGFAVDTPPALREGRERSTIYRLIAEHAQRKELAEARRLLYVACTRAQDHLFLIGADKTVRPESWQRWILDSLGFADELLRKDGSLDVEIADGAVFRIVRPRPAPLTRSTATGTSLAAEPAAVTVGAMDLERLARARAPVPPEKHYPTHTVTELLDFGRCPRLHYARHVLGLQLDDELAPGVEAERDDADDQSLEGDQRLLGIVVHELLAQFGAATSTPLEDIAQRAARSATFDEQKATAIARRAVEIVRAFEKGERGKALLHTAGLSELPFALRLNGSVLRGRIDRLIMGNPPRVVDFKLPRQPGRATRESLESEYGLQLRAYALAAARLLGADAVRAAIALPEAGVFFEWPYDAAELPQIERELVERIGQVRGAERRAALASLTGCGECVVCRSLPAAAATGA